MTISRRQLIAAYLLGRKRGQRQAQRDLEDVADRLELIHTAAMDEARELLEEARASAIETATRMEIEDALIERATERWIH